MGLNWIYYVMCTAPKTKFLGSVGTVRNAGGLWMTETWQFGVRLLSVLERRDVTGRHGWGSVS